MEFKDMVNEISTLTDLKRACNMYVIDYRNLDKEELADALIKTGPQYYHKPNIAEVLVKCDYNDNRDVRLLTSIIIKRILLNKDNFSCSQRTLNEEIIEYEQYIVQKSNEFTFNNKHERKSNIDLFKFVLDTAWGNNDVISIDERNLILKLQERLNITDFEYRVIEAQLGKFPLPGNVIHTQQQINQVRLELQKMGLIFPVRDNEGIDYDIIPEEIAMVLRECYSLELKRQGYFELINTKYVRKKAYLLDILEKSEIFVEKNSTLTDLQELIVERVKPSALLGGYSTRDGLDSSTLSQWCKDLGLTSRGQKNEIINRIISYYDEIKEKVEILDDEREEWFNYYDNLAHRNIEHLRQQNIISKDIECERKFEKATDYIFEVLLNQKPLQLIGSEHPDGILSFGEKLIFWDNKSKETKVNLKDHIDQFDRYIKGSQKPVASFIVIAPDYTDDSIDEAMRYQLLNDTVITLITADELKTMALKWNKENEGVPFPLGYFKQPGRFNSKLIK